MKLLIITQKVDIDDSVLGFFHGWIKKFAENCDQVTTICLQKGEYELPPNVKILSLGKEKERSRFLYVWRFYKYIWQERDNYNIVFAHMNPEYIVLGGILWKIWRKKIALWYTHKAVNFKLRMAEKLADIIFTASEKSFRLKSKKVKITGHGIDTEVFKPYPDYKNEQIILNVGRISPTKRQVELVKIFKKVSEKAPKVKLYLVGKAVKEEDREYEKEIKNYVQKQGLSEKIKIMGAIPNRDMPAVYQQAQILVNLSATGSLDKDVLEAMACNAHAITTNEAFREILSPENIIDNKNMAKNKIISFLQQKRKGKYREIIIKSHNLDNLIKKIIKKIKI